MKKVLIMSLFVSASLFASSGGVEHGGTDIVPRTINFLIFAGILWYLLAKPVKGFFDGRSSEIATRLKSVQDKLRESKDQKEAAEVAVEEAKRFASELQATTEKEKVILKKQIEAHCASDLEVLEKQMDDKKTLAQRRMVRDVVESVVASVAEKSMATLDQTKIAEIILKKVA